MKTRISAMICLLCVLGYPLSASAEVGDELPTISSGTIEPYLSFMAGVSLPFSEDATFVDGTTPREMRDIDYQMKQSIGGNGGIWFPTRDKLLGFDLGGEIEGYIWYPDVACCLENFNGVTLPDGSFEGTTTEIQGIYVGANFMIRRPMGISEAYPNGRWHPYIGIGGGAHQLSMRPGGSRGNAGAPFTDQRDTAPAFQAKGGFKVFLFKYLAAFAEAKYTHAFHDGLLTDRFGASQPDGDLIVNPYESTIRTIHVHAGMSLHFDIKP